MVGSKIVHRARALSVIRRAKQRGKSVVVGGPDPTLSTSYYEGSGADFICLGEGEVTVPKLLADLQSLAPERECLIGPVAAPLTLKSVERAEAPGTGTTLTSFSRASATR